MTNLKYLDLSNCSNTTLSAGSTSGAGMQGNYSTLTLPNNLTTIPKYCFYNRSNLNCRIEFPESLKTIEEAAFRGCSNLYGDLIIPDNVQTIGAYAFNDCTGLDGNLIIGSGITQIGDRAFIYPGDHTFKLNFKKIYCKALTPPKIFTYTFGTLINSNFSWPPYLGVPKGTKAEYNKIMYWTIFSTIEEVDFDKLGY